MTTGSTAATAATASALTPPSSSHGESPRWGYPNDGQFEPTMDDPARAAPRPRQARGSPVTSENGFSSHPAKDHSLDSAMRHMHSTDNIGAVRRDTSTCDRVLSPALTVDHRTGRASPSDWSAHGQQLTGHDRKRARNQASSQDTTQDTNDDSKWIHRDKLAKIENDELQAAGFYVPRQRAHSKQRRDRSQNRLGRGVEFADLGHFPPRKNSAAALEPMSSSAYDPTPQWDLRTHEEIAHDEAAAYFISHGVRGGSRIPVAKVSPAPIPLNYLERGSQAVRKPAENQIEMDTLSYSKPRSRSASLTVGEQSSGAGNARRSITDTSPKKQAPRKLSVTSKSSVSARQKTRAGPSKDFASNRPSTRTSENLSVNRAPGGDPPWLVNSYKPDPRLPPDQQLLPTVARRLQQEKWEKDGTFGDVYDKEFRPLNDRELLRPTLPALETGESSRNGEGDIGTHGKAQHDEEQQQADEWPLKQTATVSPTMRKGSYSTMPRIAPDKMPTSPVTGPRTPITHQPLPRPAPQTEEVKKVPEPVDFSKEKGPCGCCVVM